MPRDDNAKAISNYSAEWVKGYFDEFGMREWERLAETPVDEVTFHVHTFYLQKYVPAGLRVLEIGAGPGRFTQVLADLGAQILVADISQVQLELNEQHARRYGFAHAVEDWQQIDICNMAQIGSESFDCVVAYGGPFSYVLDRRDMALQESLRVLRPKGLLLLSVGSLWGSAHRHLNGVLATPVESNRKITATGDISPQTFPERNHYLHLFRSAELRDWLAGSNLTILALSASNCLSLGWDDFLQEIRTDEEKWNELLRMEIEVCAEEGCLDMGTLLIGIAKKR